MSNEVTSPVCRARIAERAPFGRILEVEADVSAGEVIVCEPPRITVASLGQASSPDFYIQQYATLSAEQRALLTAYPSHPESTGSSMSDLLPPEVDHFRRVLCVNGHAYIISGATKQTALFYHITIAAHSCAHNAHCVISSTSGLGRLVAAKDLKAGEEVTVSYIPNTAGGLSLWPRWLRQKKLWESFAFNCSCSRCLSESSICASEKSLALQHSHEQWDGTFADAQLFLKLAECHMDECNGSTAADDRPFHIFRAWLLKFQFHANHYCRSSDGEAHFLLCLDALARLYELIPPRGNSVHDTSALMFLFVKGSQVVASRPDATSPSILSKLWPKVGVIVRDWADTDGPEYKMIVKAFGEPIANPGDARVELKDIVSTLRSVQPCSKCGRAGTLRCGRCHLAVYCGGSCQRAHWPEHKRHGCQAAAHDKSKDHPIASADARSVGGRRHCLPARSVLLAILVVLTSFALALLARLNNAL